MDGQKPPQSHITITTQGFNEGMQELRKDLDASKILALQMMIEEGKEFLPLLREILSTQKELIDRVSTLEQQEKDRAGQKKQKHQNQLSKVLAEGNRNLQILEEQKQLPSKPICPAIAETNRTIEQSCSKAEALLAEFKGAVESFEKRQKINTEKNQSIPFFKIVATSLVTTCSTFLLAWWLWIYTHQT